MSSEEEEEGTKLLGSLSAGGARKVGESSSPTKDSLIDAIELLGVSIGTRICYGSSKTFADFVYLILTKLDLSEVYSSREDQSFVFDFYYMEKVKVLIFDFPYLLFHSFFFLVSV